jgi:hypothetical protein
MTEEFNEVADLTPPYRSGIDTWDGRLCAPQPERGIPTQPPANNMNLSGIGSDPDGRGVAARPVISPLSASSPQTPDVVAPNTMIQAAHLSGIPTNGRPIISRDNNIVVFYENRKTNVIHVRIQAAGDRLQAVDRPATPADRQRYPKQWDAFAGTGDAAGHSWGTSLTKLFQQQPTLVKQLIAENIPTVEHLANLGDPGIEAIAPLGGIELVQKANEFLERQPVADLQAENAALQSQVADLQQQLADQKPKRARSKSAQDQSDPA